MGRVYAKHVITRNSNRKIEDQSRNKNENGEIERQKKEDCGIKDSLKNSNLVINNQITDSSVLSVRILFENGKS